MAGFENIKLWRTKEKEAVRTLKGQIKNLLDKYFCKIINTDFAKGIMCLVQKIENLFEKGF